MKDHADPNAPSDRHDVSVHPDGGLSRWGGVMAVARTLLIPLTSLLVAVATRELTNPNDVNALCNVSINYVTYATYVTYVT